MPFYRDQLLFGHEVVERPYPLYMDSSDQLRFKSDHLIEFPEVYLWKGEDILISPEGILFDGLKMLERSLPERCRNWTRRGLKSKVKARLKNTFSSVVLPEKYFDKALWVTDLWSNAYYHWWIEACPRLMALKEHWNEKTLLLPSHFRKFSYIQECLNILGIENYEFINSCVKVRELYFPELLASSGTVNSKIIKALRAHLMLKIQGDQHDNVNLVKSKRVYVSRSKSTKRRISNEPDLLAILEKFNFFIIKMEDLSLKQQMEMMQDCEVLIGGHGAGLTNMLFMKNPALIIELITDDEMSKNTYLNLASALKINYTYVVGQPCDPNQFWNETDIVIEPSRLETMLVKALDE